MTWFLFALLALILWSGADLFAKLGSPQNDRQSHFKMIFFVGLVMGLNALREIVFSGIRVTFSDIVAYLPASAFYISSMFLGYIALRYLELSVSSPICNASGAVAALFSLVFLRRSPSTGWIWVGVVTVGVGVVLLGTFEMTETEEERDLRQKDALRKYRKSLPALLIPVAYCLLDAAGTVADSVILEEMDEGVAEVAYNLTFAAMAVVALVIVAVNAIVKKENPFRPCDGFKAITGVCETAGEFCYIYAISDAAHFAPAAAIISAYCAGSVLLGRIFMKEKLSWKQYLAIAVTVAGIILLGVVDG